MNSKFSKQIIPGFFVLDSLAVLGLWAMNLSQGAFAQGIWTPQAETSLPVMHLAAEFLMASVTLTGAVGMWSGKRWGAGVFLLGVGMFSYSALNSLGWAVVNDPVQGIPMGLTLIAVLVAALSLKQINKTGEAI
ncbi:MAG: hypothetical protein KGY46_11795 [Anaerolineales bacterium]|nr:hypothetical protein [Anaerolineales bacterium]